MFRRGLVKGKLPGAGDRRNNNEPEYEEVGPPTHLRKPPESRGDGEHCDLCGSAMAAVRCDRCANQAFCLSCDDMYHRHPRRSTHVRKALDAKVAVGSGVRPPLPPKGESPLVPPPQPPPRKNKRSGFLSNSGFSKKDQCYARPGTVTSRSTSMTNLQSAATEGSSAGRTIMGSLKRIMGARPLPPPPDHAKGPGKEDLPPAKALTRATTSPSLPNLNDHIEEELRGALPESVLDLNQKMAPVTTVSTPATPASAHAQYPPLQPKTTQSAVHTHSLGRKFSLQQLPQSFEDKRTSMVESTPGGVPWEGEPAKPPPRNRSHSVSDDQWAQVMAAQTNNRSMTPGPGAPSGTTTPGPACPPGHTVADMSAFTGVSPRRNFTSVSSSGGRGRGMVSSASVCDLNTLAQQQQHQQQPQGFNSTHAANSFQQLNMMGFGGGVMWGAPCDLCQAPPMFAGQPSTGGMKRTASNLSMNLSSMGSDVSGYPWGPPPPHVHHHIPMYPGYYPGYHPHMGMPPMGAPMGLNMSIPDSMQNFGKVPSSPAPSVRSSSHRSHKSSKSRSFSAADNSGRRSRRTKRSEESEDSRTSSGSDDVEDVDERESRSGHGTSSLAWQCDHCTYINNGGTRTCGMCSKTVGSGGRTSRRGSERRRSERRRDRRTDHDDDDRDFSDYDNDSGVVKSNFSFNIKESKRDGRSKMSNSNKNKNKKKSRRRGSSASPSGSGSEGEEERLTRHMKDLRVSSSARRRGSDYEGTNKDKDRDKDRASRKKEGKLRWKEPK